MTDLDPKSTALVLIDLQNGIMGMTLAPRSGADVLAAGADLARLFRAAGAPVALVRVGWTADFSDMPPRRVDLPIAQPEGGLPAGWSDLADGLAQDGDEQAQRRQVDFS